VLVHSWVMASGILGLNDSTPRSLVLSTWFVMNIRGEAPGGLPADFLTHGAAALLLFDEVICDAEALNAERRSYRWTSSRIFCDLEKARILRPVNLIGYVPKPFWDALETSGRADVVREAMCRRFERIHPTSTVPKRATGLPAIVRRTNNEIFSYGLAIPAALRYDWCEHYFAAPRRRPKRALDDSSVRNECGDKERKRFFRLARVLNMMVPRISLIPPIRPNSDAAAALVEAKARESSALVRWICGDPTMNREAYHDFRLGGAFVELDKRIDSPRQNIALDNLDKLLRLREETKAVRGSVQRTIGQVVDGSRSVQDVQRELNDQLKAVCSHFIGKSKVASSCFVVGPELVYEVLREILPHLGRELPIVGIPFKAAHVAEATCETVRNAFELRTLITDNPLAFFSVGASRLKSVT